MLLFLALELGLAWVLLYFKIRTFGNTAAAWMGAYRFWVRLFALAFILSFAASMPVLLQFGSVWPGLMEQVGDVIGP
ncbi:cytochrome ubiquinol oxidase subunit I, partial [Burkholderia vietnamiensis]|uniref:cytochrome ubiquinol oxidase subunit I n=2 Tax=Burkholderiales TaxID=80840 RepID=UPI002DD4236D